MSGHTPGNWIAYQDKFQAENSTHWSIGIENQWGIHGVGADDHYMLVSGICSKADALVMASSRELLEALEFLANVARTIPGFPSPMALKNADAAIAKVKGGAA